MSDVNYKNTSTPEQAEANAIEELRSKIAQDSINTNQEKDPVEIAPDSPRFIVYSDSGAWVVYAAIPPNIGRVVVLTNPGFSPKPWVSSLLYDGANLMRFNRFSLTEQQVKMLQDLDDVLDSLDYTKKLLVRYPDLADELKKHINAQERFLKSFINLLREKCENIISARCRDLLTQYKATRPKED